MRKNDGYVKPIVIGSFKEKFAVDDNTGSFVFKANAMADRLNLPRIDIELENKTSLHVRGEAQLQNDVASLLAIGCKLKSTETLEEFVVRNKNKLVDCETVIKHRIY